MAIHTRHVLLFMSALALTDVNVAPSVTRALAQTAQTDQQLIARLDELTRRKGATGQSAQEVCQPLDLKPGSDCGAIYVVGYDDKDVNRYAGHAFYTFDEPATGSRRFIFYRYAPEGWQMHLVDREAKLLRSVTLKDPTAAPATWLPLAQEQAAPLFRKELDYWRIQQEVVAKAPDRTN